MYYQVFKTAKMTNMA